MGKLQKKKDPQKKRKARQKAQARAESKGLQRPSAQAPAPRAASGAQDGGARLRGPKFWRQTVQFLREVRIELKKVTWPSRKQTIGTTLVVLVFVAIFAAFLGVTDTGLSSLVAWVLPH